MIKKSGNINISTGKVNIQRNYDASFFEVHVQDFGDSYHDLTEEDELSMKAREIHSQYTNPKEFLNHLEVYKEYMERLYEKYGGERLFHTLASNGYIKEHIPPKPALKRTVSSVLDFEKYGIISSGAEKKLTNATFTFLEERLQNIENSILETEAEKAGVSVEELPGIPEKVKMANPNMDEDEILLLVRDMKNQKVKSTGKSNINVDLAKKFYNGRNGIIDEAKYSLYDEPCKIPTLTEALSPDFNPEEFYADANMDAKENQTLIQLETGQLVTMEQLEDKSVRDTLESLGWDPKKLRLDGVEGQRSNGEIDEIFGEETPAERKKRAKKQKKARKKAEKEGLGVMLEAAKETSGVDWSSFDEYESAMLNPDDDFNLIQFDM